MSAILIAERYAHALSDSIADSKELEAALSDIDGFNAVYAENNELRTALRNPAISPGDRAAVLDGVLTAMSLHPAAKNLLKTLFARHRIGLVPAVALELHRLVDDRLNRITAHVTTATEMSPETADKVRSGLSAFSGKTVTLETDLDPEILGGMVARMDSLIIDGSLRARLNQLKQALLAEEN